MAKARSSKLRIVPQAEVVPDLTAEEKAAVEAQMNDLLTATEVEVWNCALKAGEHGKGHLSLNILPVMRSATRDMIRDFYEQAGKPPIPTGTTITFNLLVKESFLLVGNEKPQKGQITAIEEVKADETIFDAVERGFNTMAAQLQFAEDQLDVERRYKAALFVAWTWPKRVGVA